MNRLHMIGGNYYLAAETANCSTRSIRRWEERIDPYRMAGGEQRESITGSDQLLLSICLFIYPEATADKICAFLIANGGGIYTRGVRFQIDVMSWRLLEKDAVKKHTMHFLHRVSKNYVGLFLSPLPLVFLVSGLIL